MLTGEVSRHIAVKIGYLDLAVVSTRATNWFCT